MIPCKLCNDMNATLGQMRVDLENGLLISVTFKRGESLSFWKWLIYNQLLRRSQVRKFPIESFDQPLGFFGGVGRYNRPARCVGYAAPSFSSSLSSQHASFDPVFAMCGQLSLLTRDSTLQKMSMIAHHDEHMVDRLIQNLTEAGSLCAFSQYA